MRRQLAAVLGWLAAATAATAIGLAAVSLLSQGLTEGAISPLSKQAVARDLAEARAHATPPAAPASTEPPASPKGPASSAHPTSGGSPGTHATQDDSSVRSVTTPGGTVIARCRGKVSYLVSWSPAQGWSVDEHHRGPARSTLVRFEGETDANDDLTVTVTLTCRSGEPVPAVITSDD